MPQAMRHDILVLLELSPASDQVIAACGNTLKTMTLEMFRKLFSHKNCITTTDDLGLLGIIEDTTYQASLFMLQLQAMPPQLQRICVRQTPPFTASVFRSCTFAADRSHILVTELYFRCTA